MYAEMTAAFSSLKTATDIAKSLLALREFAQFNSQLADLLSAVVDARLQAVSMQEAHTAVASRVKELEQELETLKNWEAEAKNYEPLEVSRGVFAYVSKSNAQPLQSAQKLCSNCFHQNIKSFLQQANEERPLRSLSCHRCDAKIIIREYKDGS